VRDQTAAGSWRSTRTPFSNVAPARTRATSRTPVIARQQAWVAHELE
jgi:hypothetical protein